MPSKLLLPLQRALSNRAARRLAILSGTACSSLAIPTHVTWKRAECQNTDSAPLGWIVADMDGTLVGLPGFAGKGRYVAPTLAESPCLEPLCRWLRAGGRLLVVTSDDGDGPVRRVLDHIPSELLTRVMFSTSDGAALFRCAADGQLTAVPDYGAEYRLKDSQEYLQSVYEVARKMFLAMLHDFSVDPQLFASMDENFRFEYGNILDAVARCETTLEQLITVDTMLLPGRVRSFGTLLTRKQAGPSSHWVTIAADASVGGGGGKMPNDLPKGWTSKRWRSFERTCCPNLIAPFTTVILLGMPRHLSERYCNLVADDLAGLGLVASRAPNSVWIKPPGADKSLPVRWLLENYPSSGFIAPDAVAFGDMPRGNDAPLGNFTSAGMAFVSVGSDAPAAGSLRFHVGGNEKGMARVVSMLADVLEEKQTSAATVSCSSSHVGATNMGIAATVARIAPTLRGDE